MKIFIKSKLKIYELNDLEDVIVTSEDEDFDEGLDGEWV